MGDLRCFNAHGATSANTTASNVLRSQDENDRRTAEDIRLFAFLYTRFQQVNENFYRTTVELCSRYLLLWLAFTVENSYPQGKSDLEFIGKFHEKFAGRRWVIEFKCYSNAELTKMKTTVDKFTIQEADMEQIRGYATGLRSQYAEARISLHVIYCFGNQGFRVFDVTEANC